MQDLFGWVLRAHPFPYGKQVAAWAMALLWSIGGATTLLVVLLPHPPELHDQTLVVIGCTSPITALVILLLRDRLPMWIYPWILATGTLVVTVLVYAGGGGTASVSLSYFYTWVAVYALLFFRPIVALLQLVFAGTAYGVVLLRLGSFAGGNFTALEPTILAAVILTTGGVILLLSHARAASELDPLTAVANRRGLDRALDEALHGDEDSRMVLAVIDIDHFKQINDRDGHQAGDEILRELSSRWKTHLRSGDTLARFGGDEFVVLLPACTPAAATGILERLRDDVPVGVTCSFGCATAQEGDSASLLLTRADTALYEAKRLGRDRIEWAS